MYLFSIAPTLLYLRLREDFREAEAVGAAAAGVAFVAFFAGVAGAALLDEDLPPLEAAAAATFDCFGGGGFSTGFLLPPLLFLALL